MHSHQDPSSTILYVLESLDALARDSDEKRVAVVHLQEYPLHKLCGGVLG